VGLSDETIDTLKLGLGEIGVVWEALSDEDQDVEVDGETLPLTHAVLGVPASCSEARAHEVLTRLRAESSLRLAWPELAKAVADPAAAEHERAAAAWDPD
jgi:hypothetical protein